MDKPKFTQQMTMHMNGGSKFSELHYAVYRDGVKTQIVRGVRTNGSPKYIKAYDIFRCGDETFDVLETKGVGLQDWLESHSSPLKAV